MYWYVFYSYNSSHHLSLDSCQTNGDPRDRKIIDNDELENKEEQTGRDLGYMVRDMASSIRTWSYQLDHMVCNKLFISSVWLLASSIS